MVHEVDGQPPASSYIRHRILMYELAGYFTNKSRTSWILLIVLWSDPKKILSRTEKEL
jgi:hypothetical protein